MSRITLAAIATAIADLFADNSEGLITETKLRSGLTSFKDSFTHLDTFETHTGNTSNPHGVTKAQVGLGAVDNTADADKPVSTAQQTALDTKHGVAAAALTGTVIKFDQVAVYGTPTVPLTGNLTADLTGAKPGTTVCVVHNNTSEPTYGAQLKKTSDSIAYTNSVNNYYIMTFMGGAVVMYRIVKQ